MSIGHNYACLGITFIYKSNNSYKNNQRRGPSSPFVNVGVRVMEVMEVPENPVVVVVLERVIHFNGPGGCRGPGGPTLGGALLGRRSNADGGEGDVCKQDG